jgi:hypothetical protein
MAIIRRNNNNNAGADEVKQETYTLLVGMQISRTMIESSMEIPQKLEIELPCDPVILLFGIYPKELNTGYSKDTCAPMFITALFTIAKLWKQPRCPTSDDWIMKL